MTRSLSNNTQEVNIMHPDDIKQLFAEIFGALVIFAGAIALLALPGLL